MTTLTDIRLALATATLNTASRVAGLTGDAFGRLDMLGVGRDPYPIYDDVRSRGRLVKSRLGVMLTASHDACNVVLSSPDTSSAEEESPGGVQRLLDVRVRTREVNPIQDSFISRDAPDHTRLRRLVQRGFSMKAVSAHAAMIERVSTALIADFPRRGPVDLVQSFARPLPMRVIIELIGVPSEDQPRLNVWGDQLAASLDRPRSLSAVRSIRRAVADIDLFFRDLIAQRRREPTDDLLSLLLEKMDSDVAGPSDQLTDNEIIATLGLLLIAGFETTVNLLGTGTANLLRHRDQLESFGSDPAGRINGLVEEALRFESPVQFTMRRSIEDVDLGRGDVLPAHHHVVLLLAGANRDPDVFDRPNRFDIERANARQHLAFVSGAHYCLGAALARLEAQVAWTTLAKAFPDVDRWRFAGTPQPGVSRIVRGFRTLPLAFT
jgi:cytochrome P450